MRRILPHLFLLICYQSVGQCPLDINEPSTPPTNNLLLHLPLNNNLDNLGSGNYSFNLSGASYVGTQCGQGLYFDGNDDFLKVTPSMNLVDDYTVTAWISPDSQVDWMGIFSIREQCTSSYRGYSISEFGIGNYNVPTLSNQVNKHQNCVGYSGGDRYTDPNSSITNGIETFVALTVQNNNSENRIIRLYINCEELNVDMIMDFPSMTSFDPLLNLTTTIGATSPIPGHTSTFHGTIDEVRVYNEALSHENITEIYKSCLPITVEATTFPNCSNDSAQIILYDSELDIEYQLMNITTGNPVGPIQNGNCGPLVFSTGVYSDPTQFQIFATNPISNCTIPLDTIFNLNVSSGSISHTESIEICDGDTIIIGNQHVFNEGTYTDTIVHSVGCDSIIYYDVSVLPEINFDLGNDTTLCHGDWITLVQPNPNWNTEWWNGSTQNSAPITQEGEYWLTASNSCESYTDSVYIQFEDCECFVYLPNSFTPNSDGLNDTWHPKFNCVFKKYNLTIFNRWGEIIFNTDNPYDQWNGTYRGTDCQNGVYIYELKYSSFGQHETIKKGHVVLIK